MASKSFKREYDVLTIISPEITSNVRMALADWILDVLKSSRNMFYSHFFAYPDEIFQKTMMFFDQLVRKVCITKQNSQKYIAACMWIISNFVERSSVSVEDLCFLSGSDKYGEICNSLNKEEITELIRELLILSNFEIGYKSYMNFFKEFTNINSLVPTDELRCYEKVFAFISNEVIMHYE